jgi:predicted metal-dependent peptidase
MSLAINKKLTADQRLQKAVIDIMGHAEFIALSGVMMIGKRAVVDGIPTACTNGRDELYGREFVDGLTDAELRFVVLHECGHKMYKHLSTWRMLYTRNQQKANKACDYVLNIKLVDTDAYKNKWISMPEGGLVDEKYRGLNTKQVWDLLPDDEQQGGGGSGSGGGFDEHDWDGAQAISKEEQEALAKEIDEAVRQGAVLAGKTGTGGDRLLEELLETKQDWRELLRDFVANTCAGKDFSTWRKPNRRYVGMDMLMPGSISETVGDIVIAVDTSGSIGDAELAQFMGEVTGICNQVKPSRVHVLYWDTEVARHEVYLQDELDDLVKSTKPAGGGGTMVECVPAYMQKHDMKVECVIVLTDGFLGGSWGTWSVPVLWAIKGNKHAVPSVGKAIHIDD